MTFVLHELRDTVAVRWRRELAGPEPSVRKHWNTKVSYYRAVDTLIAEPGSRGLSWVDIVSAVRPHGSRTTFFGVAGPHAKRPLIRAYRSAPEGPVRAIARLLDRATVPEMLIDETKVWSYWPHRVGWMHELFRAAEVPRPAVAECLIRVLLDWAVREEALASALDHAPPACAVEDLLVIREQRMTTAEAERMLREAIRLRLTGGCSTDGVVHLICREIRPASAPATGNRRLAQAIDQLTRNSRAPYEQRRQAVEMMRDAIRVLESAPE
ncbi:hypothetical protein [Actinoplanes sp. NPDC049265]|uniref:hypothetical protein n=1 Tax=Actinoplanes sp. NPDC049265 TaxID=3363902 RepID=UPI0037162354